MSESNKIKFVAAKDEDEDIKVSNINTMNILIVGLTGSGKSSIIESLCGSDEVKIAKMCPVPVTKNLNMYLDNKVQKNGKEYVINLFDTVGLGDGVTDVPTILKQIMEIMPKELSWISKIVFCFKMDRLRAKMSEELSILYNFFKMVGAKEENFVMCLTFTDILSDDTIGKFWTELEKVEELPMVREIKNVTYTSFPNIAECEKDEDLIKYLKKKIKSSRMRIFDNVIVTKSNKFFPHDLMLKMPDIEFSRLCELLRNYKQKKHWFWGGFGANDSEQILNELGKMRQSLNINEKKKNETQPPATQVKVDQKEAKK